VVTADSTLTVTDLPPTPPTLTAVAPLTAIPVLLLSGTKQANTSVLVNDVLRVPLNNSTTWSTTKTLIEGPNVIQIATRSASNQDSLPVTVR